MKCTHLLTALTAALVVAACGTADPTAPAMDRLEPDAPLNQRAIVDPQEGVDEDRDGMFCFKFVPASENAADNPPKLIAKDDTNDRCPGGFTEVGAG